MFSWRALLGHDIVQHFEASQVSSDFPRDEPRNLTTLCRPPETFPKTCRTFPSETLRRCVFDMFKMFPNVDVSTLWRIRPVYISTVHPFPTRWLRALHEQLLVLCCCPHPYPPFSRRCGLAALQPPLGRSRNYAYPHVWPCWHNLWLWTFGWVWPLSGWQLWLD